MYGGAGRTYEGAWRSSPKCMKVPSIAATCHSSMLSPWVLLRVPKASIICFTCRVVYTFV